MKLTGKHAIATAITIGVFILNLLMPAGYATWMLYLIPMFLAAPALKKRGHVLLLPAIGTLKRTTEGQGPVS